MQTKNKKKYYIIPCRGNTKISKVKNWQNVKEDKSYNLAFDNLAGVLTEHSLVIDIDIKNNENAFEKAKEFCKDLGIEYEFNVKTPSGGFHIYLEKDKKIKIKKKYLNKYGRGVEFKSKGSYVLIPPSVIDNNKYEYLGNKEKFIKLNEKQNEKLKEIFKQAKKEIKNEIKKEYKEISKQEIKEILNKLDPDCDYDMWIKVMIGLHNHYKGSMEGFILWKEWSEGGLKYRENKENEMEYKYLNYSAEGVDKKVTIGTLLYLSNKKIVNNENWIDNWVYYPSSQTPYINIKNLEKHNQTSFNEVNKVNIEPIKYKDGKEKLIKPTLYIEQNKEVKLEIIHGLEYNPTEKNKVFINRFDKKVLNIFRKETIPRPAGSYTADGRESIEFLIKHLEFLSDGGGSILINYLAHLLQRVGDRMGWFILLGSKLQGIGKSFLLDLVELMLGPQNCKIPRVAELTLSHNDWADCKLFLGIHEYYANGSHKAQIMDELKSVITDKSVSIRRLYHAPESIDLFCNGIFCTNYIESLSNVKEDRRIYPIYLKYTNKEDLNEARGYDDAILAKKVVKLLDNSDQIAKFLLEWEIPYNFNENKRAPVSSLKEVLTKIEEESILGLEEALTLISSNSIFYNKDYMVPSILWRDIQIENPNIALSNYNKSILREQLGYYGSFYRGRLNNKIYRIYFKNKYENLEEMQEIINKYKE